MAADNPAMKHIAARLRVEQAGQGRAVDPGSCPIGEARPSSEERSSRCPGSGAIRSPHKSLLRPAERASSFPQPVRGPGHRGGAGEQ